MFIRVHEIPHAAVVLSSAQALGDLLPLLPLRHRGCGAGRPLTLDLSTGCIV